MRTAAKVVGVGVSHGLRSGVNVPPPAEQSLLRGVKRPVTSVAASQTRVSAPFQRGSQETMDDWEFAGGLEEEVVGGGEPIGRLVFSRIPSLEEAKEATEDLKEALESYISSPRSTSSGSSVTATQVSGLHLLSSSEHLETKRCVTFDPKASQESKYAGQALRYLSENPAAQTVVASIASDPNVWNAVLQNDALKEFLQSQRTDGEYRYEESSSSAESPRESEDRPSESIGDVLSDFAQKVRVTVAEMMNNVTEYIQKIFGPSANDGKEAGSFFNMDKSAYFVSLAVMVIAIVVLKRPV